MSHGRSDNQNKFAHLLMYYHPGKSSPLGVVKSCKHYNGINDPALQLRATLSEEHHDLPAPPGFKR